MSRAVDPNVGARSRSKEVWSDLGEGRARRKEDLFVRSSLLVANERPARGAQLRPRRAEWFAADATRRTEEAESVVPESVRVGFAKTGELEVAL
jgi:hypothetical protein